MKLGKSKVFTMLCLGVLAGVFLGRFVNYQILAAGALGCIALLTIFWHQPRLVLVAVLGLAALAGAVRYLQSFPNTHPNFVGQLFNQTVELTGVIVREPDVRDSRTNLTIKPRNYEGNILLNVSRYPEYHYGDELKISGKVEAPFVNEEFSYKDYLSRFDTYAVMRFPKVETLALNQGNIVIAQLLKLKAKFLAVLAKALPEPHNALAGGIILGLKRNLPDDLKAAMVAAGITHIIVVSGYNISIVTKNILAGRHILGRKLAFLMAFAALLALVILTGAEASVIRAAIMGGLFIVAMNVGRIYQADKILILAGAAMVFINPKILHFDIGFQLSFAATLGLIFLSPIFEMWLARMPNFLWMRTNLAATTAALIFTWPLISFYFDRFSLVAIVVNVLVVWIIPYAMFFAFVAGLLGWLFAPAAQMTASLLWVCLEYVIRIAETFARIPFADVSLHLSLPLLAGYYMLLTAGLWAYRNQKKFFYQLEYIRGQI